MFSRKLILTTAALFMIFGATHRVWADDDDDDDDKGKGKGKDKDKKVLTLPTGSWFGIARACPANPATDSATHAAFCTAVCGACPSSGFLPPEITFLPSLLLDGTLLADDAAQIAPTGVANNYHTSAHGRWTVSENDGLPNRPDTNRLKGTFLWLGTGGQFTTAVRTRFVTYFDKDDPDRMIGFLQPFMFTIALGGQVVVLPPPDAFAGNHIPATDPLATLPAGCNLAQGCVGTYHFVIRRIKAQ